MATVNWLPFSLSPQELLPSQTDSTLISAATTDDVSDWSTRGSELLAPIAGPKLEDFLGGISSSEQHHKANCNMIPSTSSTACYTSSGGSGASADNTARKMVDMFGQRTSIYRGVTRQRWTGRYKAHLWDRREGHTHKGRQVFLGVYDKEEKAARAYDLAALKYRGPKATTNFPVTCYKKELEDMKHMTRQAVVASLRNYEKELEDMKHMTRKSSGFSRGASIYWVVTRHYQHGRWQARIGQVAGNKDPYLGTFSQKVALQSFVDQKFPDGSSGCLMSVSKKTNNNFSVRHQTGPKGVFGSHPENPTWARHQHLKLIRISGISMEKIPTETDPHLREIDTIYMVNVSQQINADGSMHSVYILDSGSPEHCTGDISQLSDYRTAVVPDRYLRGAGGALMRVHGTGSIRNENFQLDGVLFVPGLNTPNINKTIISVTKLNEQGFSVHFNHGTGLVIDNRKCEIAGPDGTGPVIDYSKCEIVGKARKKYGHFMLDFLRTSTNRDPMPILGEPGLLESWWNASLSAWCSITGVWSSITDRMSQRITCAQRPPV